jgi:adenine-specific DNA-methyltransferase
MLSRLGLQSRQSVLEPSAGDGAFVQALLETGLSLNVCCIDKDPEAVDRLVGRFGDTVQVVKGDTILDVLDNGEGLLGRRGLPLQFDRIIGNPPYGGWLDYETRAALKKSFPGYHVRETYGLFFLRCLDLLSHGGVLCFIVPDTFLAVGSHRPLRELLLRRTEILEVVTLPSKLFPGVVFGYSDLCIITLRKPRNFPDPEHSFRMIAIKTAADLKALAASPVTESGTLVLQRNLLQRTGARIWTSTELDLEKLIHDSKLHLGDVAECRTGIYTGDNKRFIRLVYGFQSRGDYYGTLAADSVCKRSVNREEMTTGIVAGPSWVPIVKGGSHRFHQPDMWAVDWSKAAIAHYKNDVKARFQNSDYYFREGIGVPMVTSSRVNAFLLGRRVFDQSVVGIFPRRREWLFPLLVLLNSDYATRLLKEAINPTANNSANYLKKLPLPNSAASEMRDLGALGRLIVRKRGCGLPTETEEQEAEEMACALYRREQLPTKPGTWLDAVALNADTPLFPCLREKPRSYGSKQRGRIS